MDDVHETVPHTHAPEPATVAAEKVSVRMRSSVSSNPAVRPSQVIASELQTAPPDARAAIGKKETVRRRIRRQKRGLRPAEPTSLDQLDIPDVYKTTGENPPLPFLVYDSGPTAAKRMLIFARRQQRATAALIASGQVIIDINVGHSVNITRVLGGGSNE